MKCCIELNIMRIIVFFLSGLILTLNAMGQAKPYYTQYILNNYILNPALSGIENYTDLKMSYRNQWTGIDGAPETGYFSIHTPVGKSDYKTTATSFNIKGYNPRGNAYWDNYTASPAHHGLGFVILNDKSGFINRWSASASYAYHIPLTTKTNLSAGFNAGISSVNLDRSKITYGDLDPNDPAIGYSSGDLKKIKPELGVGLWLYSADYFAGISILNIVLGKNSFVNNNKYGDYFTPNYFVTAGYRFNIADDFNMIPSIMLQYWKPQLIGSHFNVKLQYRDVIWLGAGYRNSDFISGYSALFGMNLANTLNLSYSYEVSNSSRLRNYTGNTNEIMIGFILGNKFSESCPRNLW